MGLTIPGGGVGVPGYGGFVGHTYPGVFVGVGAAVGRVYPGVLVGVMVGPEVLEASPPVTGAAVTLDPSPPAVELPGSAVLFCPPWEGSGVCFDSCPPQISGVSVCCTYGSGVIVGSYAS